MKIDMRVVLIIAHLLLVASISAQVTVSGDWTNSALWGGILLGANLGAAIFGVMLYKQGQLLDAVIHSYSELVDMFDELLEAIRRAEKITVKKTISKRKKLRSNN